MSKQRAKKKQRRRARAGDSTPAQRARERASVRAGGAGAAPPPPLHPSRLEVRDGISRPDPVWAPFPLTEIAIAVGVVLFGAGYLATAARSPALLGGGALVLVVAVGELCVREHFAGFRSHSILLALLPVTVIHTLVVYALTPSWAGPLALAVDLAVVALLAWYLHGRFRTAQARARLAR